MRMSTTIHLDHNGTLPKATHDLSRRHGVNRGWVTIDDDFTVHGDAAQFRALAAQFMAGADAIDADAAADAVDADAAADAVDADRCDACGASLTHWCDFDGVARVGCDVCDIDTCHAVEPEPVRTSHTMADRDALIAVGVDPDDVAPREHDVACTVCQVGTWNIMGRCDRHYLPPVRKVATLDAEAMS